jgi:hypothetical protein
MRSTPRSVGHTILTSLLFALLNWNPPQIQRQLDESIARFVEFQKKLDEGRSRSPEALTPFDSTRPLVKHNLWSPGAAEAPPGAGSSVMKRSQTATAGSGAIRPPACPKCGTAMLLALIVPHSPGHETHTFECLQCGLSESSDVKFNWPPQSCT